MNQVTIASIIIAVGLVGGAFIFSQSSSSNAQIPQGELKTFEVTLENNRYNPSAITVNLGDTVEINFTNKDNVGHGVGIAEFNATVPNGHIPALGTAQMRFVATKRINTDTALCGGANPEDKSDDHGEEFIVNVI